MRFNKKCNPLKKVALYHSIIPLPRNNLTCDTSEVISMNSFLYDEFLINSNCYLYGFGSGFVGCIACCRNLNFYFIGTLLQALLYGSFACF